MKSTLSHVNMYQGEICTSSGWAGQPTLRGDRTSAQGFQN